MGSISEPKFIIPREYLSELQYTKSPDERSDDEILESLQQFTPVTSEKNIWAFWDKGLSSMPSWCQRNVINWIRLNGSSWTVRVLDSKTDSPNHFLKYIDAAMLPKTLVEGSIATVYSGPHSSDFLRGACLYTYGGVYMDTGTIMIRDLDRICWNRLADPNCPFQITIPIMYGTVMANHFVASRKGDPFIKRWHDLFIHLWKDRQTHEGLITHPLIAFALDYDFSESQRAGYSWDFKVEPQTVFEYISQVLCWMRVSMLEEPNDGFNGIEYRMNKVHLLNALQETFPAEASIGFGGTKVYKALSLRVEEDRGKEGYEAAEKMVWTVLARSSMQKITHGKNLTFTPALGVLWDEDENPEKDIEPGTFAELLRYGSVNFQQTRGDVQMMEAERPKEGEIIRKGLLEP